MVPAMQLFVYGTLMDPDVLRVVLGRPLPEAQREEAEIFGFRRVHVPGRNYPMLQPHHGSGRVAGLLVHRLDAEAVHRLVVYEGSEYHLVPLLVSNAEGHGVRAGVFLCDRSVPQGHRDWFLEVWVRRYKRTFLRRASALMERHGTRRLLRRVHQGIPALAPKEPKYLAGRPPSCGRFING